MITRQQKEIYMNCRQKGCTQSVAAAKAGCSERFGREFEKSGYKQDPKRHNWRTRSDPLEAVWDTELAPMLEQLPALTPITLLEYLQDKYQGEYPDKLLRTLQRRVKSWKVLHGPDKEVIFRQTHEPGQQALSDFTQLKRVAITIDKQPFKHLLYHFKLAYSRWSYLRVVQGGESFSALAEGLQEALWRLGGSPKEHRTDSLSAAFKNLSKDAASDITQRYEDFCQHYHMKATRNNLGVKHENGSVECAHGHVKQRIRQALLLRGSNDFKSVEAYQVWLEKVVSQHNQRNAIQLNIEREHLQSLPKFKTADFTEAVVKVSSSSTIDMRRVTYTVPSRLEGEALRVHIYQDRLECFRGTTQVITLPRIYPIGKTERARCVDYRHVIHSLARKPQAFRYSQLRDDLLPSQCYRQIWRTIDEQLPGKSACKLMVGLLYLAYKGDCETALGEKALAILNRGNKLSLIELQRHFNAPNHEHAHPDIKVQQHKLSSYNQLLETRVAADATQEACYGEC
jgi:hypothetical protein